tara:strand:+ start:237896 stop:238303 length:408 start_codon:yes stop_codon:yes gene_type:complete
MKEHNKPLLLGDFELETLEYFWKGGTGNAKAIHAELGVKRGNTLNTVQSTLDRLYKKGLLNRAKQGHSFHYESLSNRTEILTRKFNDLASELSGGEMKSVFEAFIEFTSRVDASKLDELETLITDFKARQYGDER